MNSQKAPKSPPSMDQWLKEAKADPDAARQGMYVVHNGVVRRTTKAKARLGVEDGLEVEGLDFSYDAGRVETAIAETYRLDGIFHVRVWLNQGRLKVGDDIMYVLVGGDIRPRVIDALQFLVEKLKTECVTETEITVRTG